MAHIVGMLFWQALNEGRSRAGRKGKACQVYNRNSPQLWEMMLVTLVIKTGSEDKIKPWTRKRFSI